MSESPSKTIRPRWCGDEKADGPGQPERSSAGRHRPRERADDGIQRGVAEEQAGGRELIALRLPPRLVGQRVLDGGAVGRAGEALDGADRCHRRRLALEVLERTDEPFA